jgi:protein-S-isoprenylcysteine O-methyltransferase Ste14
VEIPLQHFGQWEAVIVWVFLFGLFIVFIPLHRKSQKRPASVYVAFIVALALEMFGIPLSMYIVSWAIGITLPEGILWGHTLQQYIGSWGMYVGFALNLIGAYLVILGWSHIHKHYWSKDTGKGTLITEGVYRYIRHPQYTGFILITLGLLIHWATIPLLIMWPILLLLYYRLALKEEQELEKEFGDKYREYRKRVPMFMPLPSLGLSKNRIARLRERAFSM